jgi:hypothetical protein
VIGKNNLTDRGIGTENIEMEVFEIVGWILLPQDRGCGCALVNTVLLDQV